MVTTWNTGSAAERFRRELNKDRPSSRKLRKKIKEWNKAASSQALKRVGPPNKGQVNKP
mgnify:CR=1|tara:strand:+ start:342 stop:518 length:177 start_codon:yes stop_codon:yes gene_type:complete